jgi:hypothetical protein
MMRSLSTSAFGQPSDTNPTRGAGLGVARRGLPVRAGAAVAVFGMGGF